jgi:hypothetical protein
MQGVSCEPAGVQVHGSATVLGPWLPEQNSVQPLAVQSQHSHSRHAAGTVTYSYPALVRIRSISCQGNQIRSYLKALTGCGRHNIGTVPVHLFEADIGYGTSNIGNFLFLFFVLYSAAKPDLIRSGLEIPL